MPPYCRRSARGGERVPLEDIDALVRMYLVWLKRLGVKGETNVWVDCAQEFKETVLARAVQIKRLD